MRKIALELINKKIDKCFMFEKLPKDIRWLIINIAYKESTAYREFNKLYYVSKDFLLAIFSYKPLDFLLNVVLDNSSYLGRYQRYIIFKLIKPKVSMSLEQKLKYLKFEYSIVRYKSHNNNDYYIGFIKYAFTKSKYLGKTVLFKLYNKLYDLDWLNNSDATIDPYEILDTIKNLNKGEYIEKDNPPDFNDILTKEDLKKYVINYKYFILQLAICYYFKIPIEFIDFMIGIMLFCDDEYLYSFKAKIINEFINSFTTGQNIPLFTKQISEKEHAMAILTMFGCTEIQKHVANSKKIQISIENKEIFREKLTKVTGMYIMNISYYNILYYLDNELLLTNLYDYFGKLNEVYVKNGVEGIILKLGEAGSVDILCKIINKLEYMDIIERCSYTLNNEILEELFFKINIRNKEHLNNILNLMPEIICNKYYEKNIDTLNNLLTTLSESNIDRLLKFFLTKEESNENIEKLKLLFDHYDKTERTNDFITIVSENK